MASRLGDGDWRSIAEQISKETDPAKLTILVEKLCCALDGERRAKFQSAAAPTGPTIRTGNEPGFFLGD